MAHKKYLIYLLLLLLFINSISNENSTNTKNETKSLYDYEDDEQEEDRKKGINETHILILNDSNYTEVISKYESLFLIFYLSPCQNCKIFMPHFIRLSHYAYDFNLKIKFAKVDGKTNEEIVKKYNIETYPTIILFYKNQLFYYNKEITSAGLLKFYEKTKNGPIRELKSLKDFEIVLKAHIRVLLSTVKDKSLMIYQSLIQYASQNGDIEFVSCTTNDCIEKYGKEEIVYFHDKEDKINYYSKEFEPINSAKINSVKRFMSIFNVEYGTLLNQQYKLDMLFENEGKKAIFYFRDSKKEKYTSKDIIFKELGKELRLKDIYTYISDISGDDIFELISNFFVVNENELPTIIFYDLENFKEDSNTYRLMNVKEKNINREYILNFINDINAKKIKRDLHTSFPPKFKEKDGIRNVIGRSYDKDVIEEKKNVCILIIDEKNENDKSKQYKEILINLSEKYSDNENMNIVFEMMDGRYNEPRDIVINELEDLPLIYLYINDLKGKKVFKFIPKNNDIISESEVESFILENLKKKQMDDENMNKNDL